MDLLPLLKLEELDSTPVIYRIKDMLTMRGNVLFSAFRKAGKTSLMWDLIRALTQETPFLGEIPCKPLDGVLVYVNLELEQSMLREYAKNMGVDIKRNDDIRVLDYCGRLTRFKLTDEDWRLDLAEQLRDAEAAALIIDPIHPIIAVHGHDSNDNDEARAIMELLGEIRREADLDHLFVVDHTGKADRTTARGASAKEDWADVLWNVQVADKQRTLTATGRGVSGDLVYTQQKDGRLALVGEQQTGTEGKPTTDGAVLHALKVADGKGLTVSEIEGATTLSQSTVQRALNDLEDMGQVERRGKSGKAELWRVPTNYP